MEKKKLGTGMLFLAYMLLAIAFGLCIYTLVCICKGGINVLSPVTIVMELLTICAGLMYFLKGCTKDASKYFKMIMLLTASAYLLDFIGLAIFPSMKTMDSAVYIEILLNLVCYGNYLLLGAGNDLGQNKTFVMLIVNSCICLYGLIAKLGAAPEVIAINAEFFVMSFVAIIGARAKYIDKSNRNSE